MNMVCLVLYSFVIFFFFILLFHKPLLLNYGHWINMTDSFSYALLVVAAN